MKFNFIKNKVIFDLTFSLKTLMFNFFGYFRCAFAIFLTAFALILIWLRFSSRIHFSNYRKCLCKIKKKRKQNENPHSYIIIIKRTRHTRAESKRRQQNNEWNKNNEKIDTINFSLFIFDVIITIWSNLQV